MKEKLLIFTDCYIYGGSERLMAFLTKNPVICKKYDVVLSYRSHKIYNKGIANEYKGQDQNFLYPMSLLSNNTLFYKLNSSKYHKFLIALAKIPFYILTKIGVYFVYNIISQMINLGKHRPDVIHVNNGGYPGATSCNTLIIAAKLLGYKNVLYQVNNMALPTSSFLERWYDRVISKNVRFFLTASKQAQAKLALERDIPPGKIIRLPNTVKDEYVTIDRAELLKDLGIDQDCFIISVVAFLSERKGQRYIIAALKTIKNNHPEIYPRIKLLLVGNGELEEELKNIVAENGMSDCVYFLGYHNNSVNFIDACDLFVLPSVAGEDMPLAVLTAMSKGKNILATDYAGIREEIEDGISGTLVQPNIDTLAADLANKVLQFYQDRNSSYGVNAKKRFDKLFSNEVYGRAIVDLYQRNDMTTEGIN